MLKYIYAGLACLTGFVGIILVFCALGMFAAQKAHHGAIWWLAACLGLAFLVFAWICAGKLEELESDERVGCCITDF